MYLFVSSEFAQPPANVPMRVRTSLEERAELAVTPLEHLCLSALRKLITHHARTGDSSRIGDKRSGGDLSNGRDRA